MGSRMSTPQVNAIGRHETPRALTNCRYNRNETIIFANYAGA
jgi:hypothetical protein